MGGFARYRGENHPSHMLKHGECHFPTCHSGEKWMAQSATAEMAPIRQSTKWLIHGTSQKPRD